LLDFNVASGRCPILSKRLANTTRRQAGYGVKQRAVSSCLFFASQEALMELGNAFRRDALPPPLAYLHSKGLLLGKPRAEWAQIRCPIHKGGSESHPSLRVSLVDGHFRCMACGAKGGDVLALHRLLTGVSFRQAARELGAMR
jgi:hypothetical protein